MKRMLRTALFLAAVSLLLSIPALAQNTRTFSLIRGGTLMPASPSFDPSGTTVYMGGLVGGQVEGTTPATFTFSVAFKNTGVVDSVAGIYSGEIIPPFNSFAVTESYGRKSVSTSGTIDAGVVTYRLTQDGWAEIISITSNNLTIWQGKNRRRTAVGYGTLEYGVSAEGVGTMTLYF